MLVLNVNQGYENDIFFFVIKEKKLEITNQLWSQTNLLG